MKKTSTIILAGLFLASMSFPVAAQTSDQPSGPGGNPPSFPIAELGNCASKEACHAFCDQPANMQACTAYAEGQGMITADQAARAGKFAKALESGSGPGGCTSADSCNAYCSTVANLSSCLAFAKANGITDDFVTQGQAVLNYIQSGGHMPGNCTSKETCQAYCSDPSHMQECSVLFSKLGIRGPGQGGLDNVSPEMLQRFQTVQAEGKTPGSCSTFQACEQYCNDPSHGQECTAFTQSMGFGQDQMQNAQVHNGANGPGNCNSKESCDAYCAIQAHQQECQAFFEKTGNWQTGTTTGNGNNDLNSNPVNVAGPGGCDSKDSCDTYCSDPSHSDECKAFFEKAGNWQETQQGFNGSSTPGMGPNGGPGGGDQGAPNNPPPPPQNPPAGQ